VSAIQRWWQTWIKSPYYGPWFPGIRAYLLRRFGLYLFQWCEGRRLLVVAYHPRWSITWLCQLCWWANWLPWHGWRLSTQKAMPWRKGTFAESEGEKLQ